MGTMKNKGVIKIRRSWVRNPGTRVKESAKVYKRQMAKRRIKDYMGLNDEKGA